MSYYIMRNSAGNFLKPIKLENIRPNHIRITLAWERGDDDSIWVPSKYADKFASKFLATKVIVNEDDCCNLDECKGWRIDFVKGPLKMTIQL